MSYTYYFKIGTSQSGLALLSTNLVYMGTVYWPADEFTDASIRSVNGAGQETAHGWPIVEWHWGFLPDTLRYVLRTLCPNASTDLYIKTRNNETDSNGNPVWHDYSCTVIWPEKENRQAGRTIDFTLKFQALIELVDL